MLIIRRSLARQSFEDYVSGQLSLFFFLPHRNQKSQEITRGSIICCQSLALLNSAEGKFFLGNHLITYLLTMCNLKIGTSKLLEDRTMKPNWFLRNLEKSQTFRLTLEIVISFILFSWLPLIFQIIAGLVLSVVCEMIFAKIILRNLKNKFSSEALSKLLENKVQKRGN
jgi:hypothetical protein